MKFTKIKGTKCQEEVATNIYYHYYYHHEHFMLKFNVSNTRQIVF